MEHLVALLYEYVPDMAERREPYRSGHLELLQEGHAEGEVRMAGALGDPVSGGLLIFASTEAAESFVEADPYISAGLVTSHRVLPYTVAVP